MNIDQANAILSKLLDELEHDSATTTSLVVRLTSSGFVYETPRRFNAEEAAALTVWVREATKPPGAAAA